MNRGFFITATGTGAGKTIFSAGLLALLLEKGVKAAPLKAVQTGMSGSKISPDLKIIFRLSGFKPEKGSLELMQPFTFRDPCSPHLAAERCGKKYASIAGVKIAAENLLEKYDAIVAEGAGGVLVPVDRREKSFMADLIKGTGLPVILVSQPGLGAVNHACLSFEALKSRGIKIAGFIFNNIEGKSGSSYIIRDNAIVIEEYSGVKYLGTLPFLKVKNRENLLGAVKAMHGIKKLIDGEF
ncbi:MAG: dethiobiotin synthase [Candidatus Goldiibacteriota bacterium]|jgi:dethiobiotin synthetase